MGDPHQSARDGIQLFVSKTFVFETCPWPLDSIAVSWSRLTRTHASPIFIECHVELLNIAVAFRDQDE